MVKLLVIADDFTGALDTGVQFRAQKSMVFVYKGDMQKLRKVFLEDLQVLIVDTESRHLDPKDAYNIVYSIVELALQLKISYIYKKNDSGMRGNIGSELTAFWKATGSHSIHYIPAFPQMGRTTVNGIHYINKVPVAESVFGKDPFEPVKKSSINEIIAEQSDIPVLQGNDQLDYVKKGIYVYDSQTQEDMQNLGKILKEKDQLHFVAGCAGFAGILFQLLEIKNHDEMLPFFVDKLLVICGSINSVTIRQLDKASENGFYRVALSPEQKLQPSWIKSKKGGLQIQKWKTEFQVHQNMIIECGVKDEERTSQYMEKYKISLLDARHYIASVMGNILKELISLGITSTILVTGGDTLMSFMDCINQSTIIPICELIPGVVLSQFNYNCQTYNLISKSGGFGEDDLLLNLTNIIHNSSYSVMEE